MVPFILQLAGGTKDQDLMAESKENPLKWGSAIKKGEKSKTDRFLYLNLDEDLMAESGEEQ
jgi:hypothetical protein